MVRDKLDGSIWYDFGPLMYFRRNGSWICPFELIKGIVMNQVIFKPYLCILEGPADVIIGAFWNHHKLLRTSLPQAI